MQIKYPIHFKATTISCVTSHWLILIQLNYVWNWERRSSTKWKQKTYSFKSGSGLRHSDTNFSKIRLCDQKNMQNITTAIFCFTTYCALFLFHIALCSLWLSKEKLWHKGVRCGRVLLQSTVVVNLLLVQVIEVKPVTKGQPQ